MKSVSLYFSPEDIARLESLKVIAQRNEPKGSGDSFGGLNRALSWINNCDCTFISGWHPVKDENDVETRKENRKNNDELQRTLRAKGYGVIKAVGNYEGDMERSFCVFDYNPGGHSLFDDVKVLSEHYEQDSFLFKFASAERAFFCYTAGDKKGKREDAGKLSICSRRESNYTYIGSGKITFE